MPSIMYDYMATILDQKKQKEKPKMFTLKKWNPVAMWSWDVQCDNCAICWVGIMSQLLQSTCLNLPQLPGQGGRCTTLCCRVGRL